MTRIATLILVAAVAGLGLYWEASGLLANSDKSAAEANDLANGETLYAEHCASCHGAQLEGQPEWRSSGSDGQFRAPPHDETGHTWHHPDSLLFEYTKLGGQNALAKMGVEFVSGMPGFGEQLTDGEIKDILAFIKSTWPERIQEVQTERTKLDKQKPGG